MKKSLLLLQFLFCCILLFAQNESPNPLPQNGEMAVFTFEDVEDKPEFPGCEKQMDKVEREACSSLKMLHFLYGNMRYPAAARENGIQGIVEATFIVEKDGSVSNIEIVKNIGAGCGAAVLQVLKKMPKWKPGKVNGEPVRVQIQMPVKFSLE